MAGRDNNSVWVERPLQVDTFLGETDQGNLGVVVLLDNEHQVCFPVQTLLSAELESLGGEARAHPEEVSRLIEIVDSMETELSRFKDYLLGLQREHNAEKQKAP